MKAHLIPILALASAISAFAQNPPAAQAPAVTPNAAGVSFLHIHLLVRDVAAQQAFWVALAGPQAGRGINIGTTSISITKGEPKGGNAGSAIENVTFRVKDLKDTLAKIEAAGGKRMPGGSVASVFVLAPEDVKIELIEDRSVAAPAYDHVQLNLNSTAENLPWHQKWLGAVAAPGGWTIPGTIVKVTEGKTAPTSKGTSLDHIAFDVGNLDAFLKKLEAAGIAHEPIMKINGGRGLAYVMAPGGLYMELMGSLPAAQ